MTSYNFNRIAVPGLAILLLLVAPAAAQNKKNQRTSPMATPESPSETKRNTRPEKADAAAVADYVPTHFFDFERPGFFTPKVTIEHDDAGRGKISFMREGLSEVISDPIQLSPKTVSKIEEILQQLSFLDSTENYQYENEMPQMGNNTFTLKRGGKQRTVKYNWTTHKEAKRLIDEYRRVGNEFVWRFDYGLAHENQPLQMPKLLNTLESYLKRGEISDPPHLIPMLTEISNDERVPLIARNNAARLVKMIEKAAK